MEFYQPIDRGGTVLTLGQRGIARTAALFFASRRGVEFQLQLVCRVGLCLVDLVLCQLVVGDRVKPFDASCHIAIGDALHFQLVKTAKIGDLFEGQRGIVAKPDSGRLGHDRFVGHLFISILSADKPFPRP